MSDLFYYFEEAIRIEKRELYDQYQESLAMFPAANYLDKALLRTVLVLSVVADANLADHGFPLFLRGGRTREEMRPNPSMTRYDIWRKQGRFGRMRLPTFGDSWVGQG